MSDKLTEITAWKRQEIAPFMREVSLPEWTSFNAMAPKPRSFASVLPRNDGKRAVIAEIKRRSPAAGAIATGIAATDQAINYRAADASALSILADEKFFGGTIEDLSSVTTFFRENRPAIPCLRKDFMVHPIEVGASHFLGPLQ